MARRKRAEQPAAGPHPATELRGTDENGNVRPADARYLTAEEAEALEAYKAEQGKGKR